MRRLREEEQFVELRQFALRRDLITMVKKAEV
jgi:hypothetical protein